jgi:prepilin-type N-terminal cleavage/methylation domain-containing protein
MNRARRQAGFTLTELMVVVSIIGVLVTMAIVYMRPRVRPIDVANRFGDMVREASRRAVALGPVRADVVSALGLRARTQITVTAATVTTTPPGLTLTFRLDRLQEGALGAAAWVFVDQYTTDANVLPAQWAPNVGDRTMPGLNQIWVWNELAQTGFRIQCRPNGTCDPRTVFFQAALAGPSCDVSAPPPQPLYEQCAKIAVMPLGGAITTRADWY